MHEGRNGANGGRGRVNRGKAGRCQLKDRWHWHGIVNGTDPGVPSNCQAIHKFISVIDDRVGVRFPGRNPGLWLKKARFGELFSELDRFDDVALSLITIGICSGQA
jgi:hypothetical protein